MPNLHIYDRRERALVGAADAVLGVASTIAAPFRGRRRLPDQPKRILLLRLERIGDLIMALPAIRDVRTLAPAAEIDLVVGEWNAEFASALPYVSRVLTLTPRWLARDAGGNGFASLARAASAWRRHNYDLAIAFEPDIRTNLLLALSGARWTAGWTTGGGGALLDLGLAFDTGAHTSTNLRCLVARVFDSQPASSNLPLLVVPDSARERAEHRLGRRSGRPLAGVHVSGGRLVKQWDPARFADVAARLVTQDGARILLTGSTGDRRLVDQVKATLPVEDVIDAAGDASLLELAALIERCDVFVTGDTGPMHIAAAVGTPIVAVFGPSDPRRYAPSGPHDRVIRIDLPCSPCNRIRRPPDPCVGIIPACLTGIPSEHVYDAAAAAIRNAAPRRAIPLRPLTA
jgi:lipopolysaccharide heptosyltransferase II